MRTGCVRVTHASVHDGEFAVLRGVDAFARRTFEQEWNGHEVRVSEPIDNAHRE